MNPVQGIETLLRDDGQLSPGPARLTPLGGGVSCEIFKVEQGGKTFVVKRALAKLRVAMEWHADIGRNAVEHAFYETMAKTLHGSVPDVFFHNPERGYFTMEYLEDGWSNWKDLLLQGVVEPAHGRLAGSLMGKLHAGTWQDAPLLKKFDTTANFRQLRTDPYLRSTAERRPEVAKHLLAEADRVEGCRVCLVHGDFSPKNLLLKKDRMVLLDAEVAWFGEPAFDVAFLLTHLLLKGLHHAPRPTAWEETALAAREAYSHALGNRVPADLESRCAKLLAAILLARVDGKSPAEYLTATKQQMARAFAMEALQHPMPNLEALTSAWRSHLPHSS
jgi:5-methylthioribose kinase